MNTDSYISPTQNELDTDEAAWRQSVIDDMREHEQEWTRQGKCFAWIDPEPTYTPNADLLFLIGEDFRELFPNPTTPYTRKLVLSLVGGGAIYTANQYVYVPEEWGKSPLWGPTRSTGTHLKVYASPEEEDSDVAIIGEIYEGSHYEMNAQAVVFSQGHQVVADRVAKTFALIDSDCANFFALLESVYVDVLRRPLDSDQFAELLMLDPENPQDCPSNIEPWTLARHRSARRKTLLGK